MVTVGPTNYIIQFKTGGESCTRRGISLTFILCQLGESTKHTTAKARVTMDETLTAHLVGIWGQGIFFIPLIVSFVGIKKCQSCVTKS